MHRFNAQNSHALPAARRCGQSVSQALMARLAAIMVMAFVVAVAAMLAGPVRAENFLSAADDIPLIDGLREVPDGVLVFDKPQGRIVQLTALRDSRLAVADIRDFYRRSLPNLGWTKMDETENLLTFESPAEILRLTFTADLVMFDVTPKAAR